MNSKNAPLLGMLSVSKDGKKVTISGPHGTEVVSISQPQEVGLAVNAIMTGNRLAPETSYRRKNEPQA